MFRHFRALLSLLSLPSTTSLIHVGDRLISPPSLRFLDPIGRSAPRRNATTKHPHSSTRQRTRYRRQIAAGQLQMERV